MLDVRHKNPWDTRYRIEIQNARCKKTHTKDLKTKKTKTEAEFNEFDGSNCSSNLETMIKMSS